MRFTSQLKEHKLQYFYVSVITLFSHSPRMCLQFYILFNMNVLIYIQRVLKEEFEDTKGAIRIRISKKNRQHNGQKKKVQKDKQRSTKHTYKTKDRVRRTPLKIGYSGREAVPAPLVTPVVLI